MTENNLKNELKEKNKLIAELEDGVSDEIDNLREEVKELKKKNEFLEKRDNDFQRNFETDKKLFKNQLKEIEDLKLNWEKEEKWK